MSRPTATRGPSRSTTGIRKLPVDRDYMLKVLRRLMEIPSPAGYTDMVVHYVGEELERLGVAFELTRRGAIRASLPGEQPSPDRAVVAHLDTLGAMVKNLKPNGRLEVVPVGHWSSRFAEGARVTIFTDEHTHRGTVLPLKASGHTYNVDVDTQPVNWDQIEVRVDEKCDSLEELVEYGFNVGDFIAFDPNFEITETGFINSRHLDDKAGVAALLAAVRSVMLAEARLPLDCHILFTIFEEVGSGASAVLHGDVSEMVAIDNATSAVGQNSSAYGVTVGMMDSTGPFDYHLTHKLIRLCQDHGIDHQRDVFRFYRCDAASAVEAGNDIRTALVCFGVDASHGYERTHIDSLAALADLMTLYLQSPATFKRDQRDLGPLEGFPYQPM